MDYLGWLFIEARVFAVWVVANSWLTQSALRSGSENRVFSTLAESAEAKTEKGSQQFAIF